MLKRIKTAIGAQIAKRRTQGNSGLLQQAKTAISSLVSSPANILSNPFTGLAGIAGMLSAFLADQFGSGYWIALLITSVFLIFGIWQESRKLSIYKREAIPLPIVINIANSASSENALNCLFNIIEKDERFNNHQRNLTQYLNILPSDLTFNYRGDIHNTEMLQDFLKITRHNLEKLKSQTPRNTTLYLAYIGPVSVGILVGGMLGTDGVKIFQYNKSTDSYQPVIIIQDRSLKENVFGHEKFNVNFPIKNHNKVTVAIDISSHKIKLSDATIASYGDLIYMSSKNSGTIQNNEEWLEYCREIFKVLNEAQRNYDEIRLVYSMPVALAIALGIAVQNYWNVWLTNYDSPTSTYRDLIKLNQIRYYA